MTTTSVKKVAVLSVSAGAGQVEVGADPLSVTVDGRADLRWLTVAPETL